jgi:hypothetical protein
MARHLGATSLIFAAVLAGGARATTGGLTISPPYAQLVLGQSLTFTSNTQGVIWQVDNASGLGISPGGVYTAPPSAPNPPVVTVTAVSATNPSLTATATVTLLETAPSGTTYYVATTGSDTNPGTINAPFATIQHAAGIAGPGDTVLVRGGVYNQLVSLTRSGAESTPITFATYPGETATLDGTGLPIPGGQNGLVTLRNASYVILEGFEIRNYTTNKRTQVPIGIYVTGAEDGVEIINNHIHNITTTAPTNPKQCGSDALGMAVYGTQAPASISNIAITGNELDHLMTGCSESMSLDGNVDGFLVASNLVHDNNNIGIDSIGFERVSKNPAYDQARNGEIRGNLVYNITSYGNPDYGKQYAADGIYVDGGTQIVIEQNIVHNTDLGVELASEHKGHVTSYVTARNNVVYMNNSNGFSIGGYAKSRGGSDNITIVNNTLYNDDTKNTGSGEFQIQWYATNNVFENNIVYAGAQGLMVHNFTASEPKPATLDYNLYFLPAGATKAVYVWDHTRYAGFTPYMQATGQDPHSLFADPQFLALNPPNLDIATTSPAINAGLVLPPDVVGTFDVAGNPRLGSNGKIAIGAYQHP